MSFDEIMEKITEGLTGDFETDEKYLDQQAEIYRDHPLRKEIIRACGRLLFQLMPEEKKNNVNEILQKEELSVDSTLEEVRFNMYKENYDKAESLIVPLVRKLDDLYDAGLFKDDSVSMYFSFYEVFEELLYIFHNKPKKDLRLSEIPYAQVYSLYGSLLIDLERYEEANKMLEKAIRWNPSNAGIAFEYIETFKLMGDMDKAFELTKDVFKIAFYPDDLARCYRNLAFYFVEKELWQEAIGCYIYSQQFDPDSKQVPAELYYISEKIKAPIKSPDMEELRQYSQKQGFPLGPDTDILGLSYAYGKDFVDKKEYSAARYFLEIFYHLTDDEEVKEILDTLPSEDANDSQ